MIDQLIPGFAAMPPEAQAGLWRAWIASTAIQVILVSMLAVSVAIHVKNALQGHRRGLSAAQAVLTAALIVAAAVFASSLMSVYTMMLKAAGMVLP